MRTQLIQNGVINIVSEDGDLVIDYGVPSENKESLTGVKMWSNANADIIGDIERWQKVIIEKGYAKPNRLIMTEKTFTYIKKNAAIIDAIKIGKVVTIVTDNLIKDFLKTLLGVTIAIVYGTYLNESGQVSQYYEDNKVTFIPPVGTLGNTVFGTTPEEADKNFGSGKLDTQIVRTGVAITTMLKEDPVTVETKVSVLTLPSFEKADECFFATVHA